MKAVLLFTSALLFASWTFADMSTKLIIDFKKDSTPWYPVNDSVMGGISSSRMMMEDDAATFKGTVSLENNGGFASVRSDRLDIDLAGFEGIRLRVKGDGKKYQFRIYVGSRFSDGPSYQATFETKKDTWIEVELPFRDFFAAFRGRRLWTYPPLSADEIKRMGILIASEQTGSFRINIDWIKAFKSKP